MIKQRDFFFETLEQGGEISPFLFLCEHLELLHADLEHLLGDMMQKFGMDHLSIFRLPDTGESLKIETVKTFLRSAEVQARFTFQVFYIEHFARMTPQAQNACLKFLEEPGVGNIVLLTNPSEAGILETILSRVQKMYVSTPRNLIKNPFFTSLLTAQKEKNSDECVRYFFSAKLEKPEYVDFLQTLLLVKMEQGNNATSLQELEEDIQGILQNNLQGRYIVDKWILKM